MHTNGDMAFHFRKSEQRVKASNVGEQSMVKWPYNFLYLKLQGHWSESLYMTFRSVAIKSLNSWWSSVIKGVPSNLSSSFCISHWWFCGQVGVKSCQKSASATKVSFSNNASFFINFETLWAVSNIKLEVFVWVCMDIQYTVTS